MRARRQARRRGRRPRLRHGSRRAARGTRRSRRDRLGQHRLVRVEPGAQELAERVRLLDRLGAGKRGDDATARAAQQRSASAIASSHETLVRAAARRAGPSRSSARRCVNTKRPLSQIQPSSTSGWLRDRTRFDLPLADGDVDVAADGAEPADGRHVCDLPRPASNRYCVGSSAPTGQSSMTLPVNGARVRHVLERRDHRRAPRLVATSCPSSATSWLKRVQR